MKAKNNFKEWRIQKNQKVIQKHARVTINSRRNRIILTDDRNNIEYHLHKVRRDRLEMQIVDHGKIVDKVELKKQLDNK